MIKLVGILNVTPDSFSDGGEYWRPNDALAAIERLVADGADVIDIGAESTRPGATPITHEEEWRRLAPVLTHLIQYTGVEYSIDTCHPETARKALEHGVHWINDVSGLTHDMASAVRQSSCKLVVMHSLSVPADITIVMDASLDAISEVFSFAQMRLQELENYGIARDRLIFDPGIGFGKTPAQSWALVHGIEHFLTLGVPLMVGHSRKSFLGGDLVERDAKTLEVSQTLVENGVKYLRVHDVASHRRRWPRA